MRKILNIKKVREKKEKLKKIKEKLKIHIQK